MKKEEKKFTENITDRGIETIEVLFFALSLDQLGNENCAGDLSSFLFIFLWLVASPTRHASA